MLFRWNRWQLGSTEVICLRVKPKNEGLFVSMGRWMFEVRVAKD